MCVRSPHIIMMITFQFHSVTGQRRGSTAHSFLPVHSDMAIYMTEFAAGKFFLFHVGYTLSSCYILAKTFVFKLGKIGYCNTRRHRLRHVVFLNTLSPPSEMSVFPIDRSVDSQTFSCYMTNLEM